MTNHEEINSLVNLCLWSISNNLVFIEESKNALHIPDDIRSLIINHLKETTQVKDTIIEKLLPHNQQFVVLSECISITNRALFTVAKLCGHHLITLHLADCYNITDEGMFVIAENCPNLSNLDLSGCDNITYKTIRYLVKFSKQLSELDLSECVGIDDTAFCYVTHMPSINIVNFAECNSILWNTDKLQEENLEYYQQSTLKSLCLRGIQSLNDKAVEFIAPLFPDLRIFDLSFCSKLTDRTLLVIAASPFAKHIFSLNLWGATAITDKGLQILCDYCPELKTLTICDCPNITESSIVQFIAKLKKLKTLNLWGCSNISAVSIQLFLRYFTDLAGLGLSHFTQLQDYSLKGLETSTELRSLEFENCVDLTDNGISKLGGTHLQQLIVKGCVKLSGEGLSQVLSRSPNLRHLNIASLPLLTEPEIAPLVLYCPQLQKLNLSGLNVLTDKTLTQIVNILHSTLLTLKIDRCPQLTDNSIKLILQKCRQLTELSVMFCSQLTDSAFDCLEIPNKDDYRLKLSLKYAYFGGTGFTDKVIMKIAWFCPKLRTLSIPYLKELTDLALLRVGRECQRLQHLNVALCSKLTPATVHYILSRCPRLRHLDISGIENMNDLSLNYIAQYGTALKCLDISGGSRYSEGAIIDIVQKCRALQVLKLRARDERQQFPTTLFQKLNTIKPYLQIEKNY